MILRFITENGTSKTSDFIVSNYRRNEIYHNNLQAAENTINATLPFTSEVAEFLKTHADENVKVELKENTTVISTGYLRKTFSFEKTHINKPITIQIVSPSFILDKELTVDQKELLENKTYLQLINRLLKKAEFYSSDKTASFYTSDTTLRTALSKVCPVALFDESENIKSILSQIAFELGAVYDFDTNGDFKLFPLFNTSTTITQTFDDNNIIDSVVLSKKEEECDNVCLKWQTKEFHQNSLIFSDTQSGDDTNKCKIKIAAGAYFLGKEKNYLTYDSDFGEIIYNKQITTKDVEGTIDTSLFKTNITNSGTSAEISYLNNATTEKEITKFDIYGDVWVKVRGENQTKATSGTKSKDYTIRFLNTDSDVSDLALKLVEYFRYSDFTLKLKSRANYTIGSFVTVDSEGIGLITARVIRKTTYVNNPTEYELEAINEYQQATIQTKSVKNRGVEGFAWQDSVFNKFAAVDSKVDEIKIPLMIKLYKRAPQKPETTGISSNAIFYYADGSLEWAIPLGNNGWQLTEPDGIDPMFVTVASISGQSTVVIPSTAWSDPVFLVKNGEDGTNSAEVYNIVPDFNIITRYSNGQLSSESITFKFFKANESSRGETSVYYKIWGSQLNGVWAITTTGTGTDVTVQVGQYLGFRCDIYKNSSDNIPLDSETVMVVAEGSGGIVVDLSNSNVSIPCDNNGNPTSFMDTDTLVYVLSGATPLDYGDASVPGGFEVDITYQDVTSSVTRGQDVSVEAYTDETDDAYTDESGNKYLGVSYFRLPEITSFTATKGNRTVTVRGLNFDGTSFEISTVQTFSKVFAGKDGTNGKDGKDGINGIDGKDGTNGTNGLDGKDGKDGVDGNDGKSVELRSIQYATSENLDTIPTSWSNSRPSTVPQGYYLWTRKIYFDGTTAKEYAEYSFAYEGKDGSGIGDIVEYYLISKESTGITRDTRGWTNQTVTPTKEKPYLWNYEKVILTKGEPILTNPVVIGNYAAAGGDGNDGRGISSVVEFYESNTSETEPESITKEHIADVTFDEMNCYLFNKTVTTYSDNTNDTVVRIIAVYGKSGTDGLNCATVVLYKRSATVPTQKPTANLIYTFSKPPVVTWGTSGSANGWSINKPGVDEDKLPLYEIRATASSNTINDTIKPSEWGNIEQTQMDNGLTQTEVEALIETSEENIMDSLIPVFTMSSDGNAFAVNENGIITRPQTITYTVECKRNGVDVPFRFINVKVPYGFVYLFDNNQLKITVKTGELIQNGNFSFRCEASDISYFYYTDETGERYTDDNEDEYSQVSFNPRDISFQDFTVAYSVVKGGVYFHAINSVDEIPADAVMNDYFTFTGSTVKSSKSITGQFKKSAVYTYDGVYWTEEKGGEHLSRCLSDILSIVDDELENNNSTAYEYVDHLTANDIFAKKVVSKLVESDLILSKETISNTFISYDESAQEYASTAKEEAESFATQEANAARTNAAIDVYNATGLNLLTDKTIIQGNKIKTGLIDAEALIIGQSQVTGLDQTISDAKRDVITIATEDASAKSYNALDTALAQFVGSDKVANHTLIDGAKIITGLIDAEAVLTDLIAPSSFSVNQSNVIDLEDDLKTDIIDQQQCWFYIECKKILFFFGPNYWVKPGDEKYSLNQLNYRAGYDIYIFKQYKLRDGTIKNSRESLYADSFYDVSKGYLRVNKIDVDEITAGLVKTNDLTAGTATFNGHVKAQSLAVEKTLEVGDSLKIYPDGKLEAKEGRFSGGLGDIVYKGDPASMETETTIICSGVCSLLIITEENANGEVAVSNISDVLLVSKTNARENIIYNPVSLYNSEYSVYSYKGGTNGVHIKSTGSQKLGHVKAIQLIIS